MTYDPSDPYGAHKPHRPEHDPWMTNPNDPDYLPVEDRWCRRCGNPDTHAIHASGNTAKSA